MNIAKAFIACAAAALSLPALAQAKPAMPAKPAPDAPLVVEGEVRVDVADFDGNLLRIPEDKRPGFSMSYDRVVGVVDNVFITRSFAKRARDAGLDKDPAVQARLKQVQDAFLADLYVQKLEKEDVEVDLERRARELYAADKDKYLTDEEAHVQQILIGVVCRTRGAARELARQAMTEARAGADFVELAAKYSDPGEKALKGGDIGTGPVKRLVEPVRDALAKMKPGEISEPVESQFGIHVLKLIERKPAVSRPFEAVKAQLIAQEKARLQKKRVDDLVMAVRNSTSVVTYRDNVEKLVNPGVDVEDLSDRARAAHRDPPAAGADATKK
jgi:peptidyl-prolyl cis-trans isomerase C